MVDNLGAQAWTPLAHLTANIVSQHANVLDAGVQVKAQEWTGMAQSGPDPTALLRLYIKYERLEDAAGLASSFLTHWQQQVWPGLDFKAGMTDMPAAG